MNKVCPRYCGVSCVDGTCPKANIEEYIERDYDVVKDCKSCIYYSGCEDCAWAFTNACIQYDMDYALKVEDYVNVEKNNSGFDLNDIVHICKRRNNTKRNFLFVDKYQGKHIPINPLEMQKLYSRFFDEIYASLHDNEKIVVVAFAETATALGEYVSYRLSQNNTKNVTLIKHLQTSRENISAKKLFDFSEEHSHAVNQMLYCNDTLVDFDRVLFVEDEITTGKTILNFIEQFEKINPDCSYTVASILNWQNDENRAKFYDKGIDRVYLIGGKMKDEIPHDVPVASNSYCMDYFEGVHFNLPTRNVVYTTSSFIENPRVGVNPTYFDNLKTVVDEILNNNSLNEFVEDALKNNKKVRVIGTEEFMFLPFMYAHALAEKGLNVEYNATTRSPIEVSMRQNYALKSGIKMASAYEVSRENYLYNFVDDADKVIVISDADYTDSFVRSMLEVSNIFRKDIRIVGVKLYA